MTCNRKINSDCFESVVSEPHTSPETDEEWTRRLKEIHEELRRNKAEASEKARTARELAHRKNMIKRKEEKDLAEYERLKAKFEAGVKADDHCLG